MKPQDMFRARIRRADKDSLAEFYRLASRTLDPFEFKLFRIHFLLGADMHLCRERFPCDPQAFDRIATKLAAWCPEHWTLQKHALKHQVQSPVRGYFQQHETNLL